MRSPLLRGGARAISHPWAGRRLWGEAGRQWHGDGAARGPHTCKGPGCREEAAAADLHLDVGNNYLPSDYFPRRKIKPDREDCAHPSKGETSHWCPATRARPELAHQVPPTPRKRPRSPSGGRGQRATGDPRKTRQDERE